MYEQPAGTAWPAWSKSTVEKSDTTLVLETITESSFSWCFYLFGGNTDGKQRFTDTSIWVMIKMKVKEMLLWRKGGGRLVAGSSGFWEMGVNVCIAASVSVSEWLHPYDFNVTVGSQKVMNSLLRIFVYRSQLLNTRVLGIATVCRSRAYHENTPTESWYEKKLYLMARLRQLDIDLRHLAFEVPVYNVWKRCDPHEDPCQVLYICGFHTVAQNHRLRMCVKSLLDGTPEPQWLPPIL